MPTLCVLGGTGVGKSTFCHLLSGSDPRKNTVMFKTSGLGKSCTENIEMKRLRWFNDKGDI